MYAMTNREILVWAKSILGFVRILATQMGALPVQAAILKPLQSDSVKKAKWLFLKEDGKPVRHFTIDIPLFDFERLTVAKS